MNRKKVILLTLVLVMLVLSAAVAGAASESLSLRWTSGLGGGGGGGISNSAWFHLAGSATGAALASSTSTSYQACVGFLCAKNDFLRVLLPIILRQEP